MAPSEDDNQPKTERRSTEREKGQLCFSRVGNRILRTVLNGGMIIKEDG